VESPDSVALEPLVAALAGSVKLSEDGQLALSGEEVVRFCETIRKESADSRRRIAEHLIVLAGRLQRAAIAHAGRAIDQILALVVGTLGSIESARKMLERSSPAFGHRMRATLGLEAMRVPGVGAKKPEGARSVIAMQVEGLKR
jgi:hypothetical protein